MIRGSVPLRRTDRWDKQVSRDGHYCGAWFMSFQEYLADFFWRENARLNGRGLPDPSLTFPDTLGKLMTFRNKMLVYPEGLWHIILFNFLEQLKKKCFQFWQHSLVWEENCHIKRTCPAACFHKWCHWKLWAGKSIIPCPGKPLTKTDKRKCVAPVQSEWKVEGKKNLTAALTEPLPQ